MTQPQEVTIDQMIEYCERCMADSPFHNQSGDPNQSIQEAIIGTLKSFREGSRPVNAAGANLFLFGGPSEQVIQSGVKYAAGDAVPNTQAECEDAIGKFIQERFTLFEALDRLRASNGGQNEVGLKATISAVEDKITMINGRLFYLKSQVKFILQNRLSRIDEQLESHMIDHVEEADLKGLRVRIVEKIGVIDNELKVL